MKRVMPRVLGALLLAGAVAGVACSDDGTVDTNKAKDQAQQSQQTIKQETKQAWSTLRADGEKLIDDIQTRNDPGAKQKLLDQCNAALDQIKKNNDTANADRVNKFCDRVRNTDPNTQSAWNEIKAELKKLNDDFRSS